MGTQPPRRLTAAPIFRPMSIVAKRSPISATAELLLKRPIILTMTSAISGTFRDMQQRGIYHQLHKAASLCKWRLGPYVIGLHFTYVQLLVFAHWRITILMILTCINTTVATTAKRYRLNGLIRVAVQCLVRIDTSASVEDA